MPFDHRQFRDVMGSFATGVAVATTRDAAGRPVGVTVSSFTSLSLDPPLILFCLEWVAESRADRWAGIEAMDGLHGCPLLPGTVGWVSCRKETVHEGGDHAIIVGRVEALERDPARSPLLHFRGAYGRFERAG